MPGLTDKLEATLRNFRPPWLDWLWKAKLWSLAILALLVPALIYAGLIRVPTIEFLNGMAWQPKAKAQSVSPANAAGVAFFEDGIATRPPVRGAIPRGYEDYPYRRSTLGDAEAKQRARDLKNPLPPTMPNLRRGERVYDNYCMPCHGYKGMADGPAVGEGRLAAPTSLHSAIVKQYTDGQIFHIVTEGQNKMPSYA